VGTLRPNRPPSPTPGRGHHARRGRGLCSEIPNP
jgi:hypothetical protein